MQQNTIQKRQESGENDGVRLKYRPLSCALDFNKCRIYALFLNNIMKNIVVLISGRGSNFEAILRTARSEDWEGRFGLKIAAVISNRPLAKGLDTARREGIDAVAVDHKAYPTREAFEEALAAAIEPYKPAVIVLAGFIRILTESFVARWEGKILNIHPALLPLFPGLDTHQRAIDAGCRVHGSTVHFVSSVLDGGAIIGQSVVPVLPSDTDETLAARLLPYEHKLYPQCVKAVALGEVKLIDGKAVMSDEVAHHLAIFWRKD